MAGLLGQGWEDPRSAAIMSLAGGLLKGDFGGGLLGANAAYGQARDGAVRQQLTQMQLLEAQQAMEDAQRKRQFMTSLPEPTNPAMRPLYEAARAGAIPLPDYLKSTLPKQLEYSKIDPKDYTPESLRDAAATGDYTRLVPVRKMEVVNNQVFDPYGAAPGTVVNDPFKPFIMGPNGLVPNAPVQQYEKAKARAGASVNNISVNTEKSLLNEIAGGLGKGITDAKGSAQAALGTIGTVNRLMDALDSGQVMAGPGTTFRQYGLQVGNMLGVAGQSAQEKLLNTRQAIQSLAQLELDAAQQMKGQGQITEAERAIIRRAASGDIDSMTVPELRVLGGILDRTARSKIRSFNQQAQPLVSNPNAAPLAPFLNVEEPPARVPSGSDRVRRFNPATGRIE